MRDEKVIEPGIEKGRGIEGNMSKKERERETNGEIKWREKRERNRERKT